MTHPNEPMTDEDLTARATELAMNERMAQGEPGPVTEDEIAAAAEYIVRARGGDRPQVFGRAGDRS